MSEPPGRPLSSSRAGGRKPHVLVLVDGLTGGAERFARLLTMNLDADRYRRTLCVTRVPFRPEDEELARQEMEQAGAEILMLRRSGRTDLQPWVRLVRHLREQDVDILHAHKFGSNIWASLLRGVGRVPVMIAHEHTWSYEGRPFRKLLDRRLIASRCDRFLSVSALDRQRMIEIEHIDPGLVQVLPVGIPDRPALGTDIRGELGIEATAPVLASVAYLRPQKALHVLIEAASQLRLKHPQIRVLIVGSGGERPRLEALIDSLDLREAVLLLGPRNDVMDVVQTSDIAVCCSDYEGTPQAILEYMAAAKPIVATNVGGIPDLIEDGVSGVLIPPGSPAELAASVDGLLEDPGRGEQLGRRARERQQANFSVSASVELLQEIYDELLAARGAGHSPG